MADDGSGDDKKRAGCAGWLAAARLQRLGELMLVQRPLDTDEIALLREVFPEIVRAHQGALWRYLRGHGARSAVAEELAQEVFKDYFRQVVREGFRSRIPAALIGIARGKLSNCKRGEKRDPVSIGYPTSSSEPPRTPPLLARAKDLAELRDKAIALLSDDHRKAIELIVLQELTYEDAAAVLDIPVSTLSSRVAAAKRKLAELVSALLPESERVA